jgi:hypothetical protein
VKSPRDSAKLVALALGVVLGSAPLAHAQSARSVEEIAVLFAFPDGTAKRTTVSMDEVEKLTGQRPAYKLLPWVQAALRKLELSHKSSADGHGIALTEIGGVANGPRGKWAYSVNGVASAYRLDTQTIEDVKQIAFSYH